MPDETAEPFCRKAKRLRLERGAAFVHVGMARKKRMHLAQGAAPKGSFGHMQDNRADVIQRDPIQGFAGVGSRGRVGKAVPQCL